MKSSLHKPLISVLSVVQFLVILGALASVTMAQEIQGKVTAARPAGIVVYIDTIPGKNFGPPAKHVTIDQKGMKFVPRTTVVLKGTTVDFLNSDPVGHNVFWPSVAGNKGLAHNLGTWPQGQTKSFTFNDVGAISLLCNVHPEMSGYVIVVPTPYHTVTKADGSFVIRGVPAGHYTLRTWGGGGSASQQVDVGAGITTVQVTVPR
jgi:plastocyanin